MIKLIVMKIISKFFNAYLAMNYRKRIILNGIISSILNGAMLAVSWNSEALPSIIIFSIFALVSLVSTFYFIVKKDIKKPDYRNKQGKLPMEIIRPYYSNKTHILIYHFQQMHKIRGRIDVQDLRSHEKAISGKATIAKIMQIVVGPAIKCLVTIELTGRMLVILSHVTSELFPQAFLSKIVNKDIESSICLGQNLIFLFHVNRGNRFRNKGGS